MSFKKLDPSEDFIVSTTSVSSTVWTGFSPTLTTFFTSSVQEAGSSGNYYINVYQTGSTQPDAEVQFAVSYGHKLGSGSTWFNPLVTGSSYSKSVYGQYRNLIYGDENQEFTFGSITSPDFWVISVDRSRYKEKLFLGSLSLKLSGPLGSLNLTDNSKAVSSITFNDAGRVFQLVSGSQGLINTTTNSSGFSLSSGSYGLFLPDIATIILNPLAISQSIGLFPTASVNSDGLNIRKMVESIKAGSSFKLNSEESISSDYVFIRIKNSEFNYTENPSFISGSTGEIRYDVLVDNPQVYLTTVGLYNDTNELLAVAKLSRPFPKNFIREGLIRIKLDF